MTATVAVALIAFVLAIGAAWSLVLWRLAVTRRRATAKTRAAQAVDLRPTTAPMRSVTRRIVPSQPPAIDTADILERMHLEHAVAAQRIEQLEAELRRAHDDVAAALADERRMAGLIQDLHAEIEVRPDPDPIVRRIRHEALTGSAIETLFGLTPDERSTRMGLLTDWVAALDTDDDKDPLYVWSPR